MPVFMKLFMIFMPVFSQVSLLGKYCFHSAFDYSSKLARQDL